MLFFSLPPLSLCWLALTVTESAVTASPSIASSAVVTSGVTILNVKIVRSSPSEMYVTWDPLEDTFTNGEKAVYEVRYYKKGGDANNPPAPLTTSNCEILIPNLRERAEYVVQVSNLLLHFSCYFHLALLLTLLLQLSHTHIFLSPLWLHEWTLAHSSFVFLLVKLIPCPHGLRWTLIAYSLNATSSFPAAQFTSSPSLLYSLVYSILMKSFLFLFLPHFFLLLLVDSIDWQMLMRICPRFYRSVEEPPAADGRITLNLFTDPLDNPVLVVSKKRQKKEKREKRRLSLGSGEKIHTRTFHLSLTPCLSLFLLAVPSLVVFYCLSLLYSSSLSLSLPLSSSRLTCLR